MGERIPIRRLRTADLDHVMRIEEEAFPQEAYSRALFEKLQKDCGPLFVVAQDGGGLVGYMVTCTSAEKAEIVSIAVANTRRRNGVGAALMAHTLRALKRNGVQRLDLTVRTSNASAIKFYRGFGFIRIRKVAHYYQDGGEGLRMRKKLDA